jgi:hypothetical protein
MNRGCVLIENAFGSLKYQWCIFKNLNCRIDKGGKIIMICYVFHNFCQLMDMPKLAVQDVQQKRDPLVGFHGQHVLVYEEGNVAKEVGEVICNVLFASWLECKNMFMMGMLHHLASMDILALHQHRLQALSKKFET